MDRLDHSRTDEIVCPHCGHAHRDSWEFGRDDGEFECHSCSRWLRYTRNTFVTYTTYPLHGEQVKEVPSADDQ